MKSNQNSSQSNPNARLPIDTLNNSILNYNYNGNDSKNNIFNSNITISSMSVGVLSASDYVENYLSSNKSSIDLEYDDIIAFEDFEVDDELDFYEILDDSPSDESNSKTNIRQNKLLDDFVNSSLYSILHCSNILGEYRDEAPFNKLFDDVLRITYKNNLQDYVVIQDFSEIDYKIYDALIEELEGMGYRSDSYSDGELEFTIIYFM